ncbi:unnamed protein product, partial [Thelazia callipaeda]|uniref:Oxidoreductase n=1 Tax=Thelazia callipaeda TaxID=103827 RepID=A0A0N5CQT5_THECL
IFRRDFDWRWVDYHEKAYSHLAEQALDLARYLNEPRPKHYWQDGTQIFADGYNDFDKISSNVVLSDC